MPKGSKSNNSGAQKSATHKSAPRSKYRPEFVDLARLLYEEGFTDVKVAKAFKVNRDTLHNWRKTYPELAEAVQQGKDKFNSEVCEKQVLKLIKGFWSVETTYEPSYFVTAKDKKTGALVRKPSKEMVLTRRTRKFTGPDRIMIMWFLQNRMGQRWRDTRRLELTGEDGGPVLVSNLDTSKLNDDQLKAVLAAMGEEVVPDWQETRH